MIESNEEPSSTSGLITFGDVVNETIRRRAILKGGIGMAATGLLAACGGGSNGDITGEPAPAVVETPETPAATSRLNFDAVSTSDADLVSVPEGHTARVLYAYGDPLSETLAPFANDGSEPGSEFDFRAGDHHDGMYFFGLDANGNLDRNASDRGILCVNHENITQALMHTNGPTSDADGNRLVADEVRKEQRAHGVACFEIARDATTGQFNVVTNSPFNRRITTLTPTIMTGPAAGSDLLVTRFSPSGTTGRGTVNNCANGFTPWGTYLTCEENYDLYFRDDRNLDRSNSNPETLGFANFLAGIGVRVPGGLFDWATLAGDSSEIDDEFARFNVTPTGADATEDFRNEGNQYGYVVEIDPLDPNAAPRKRTALGRFAHEGVWPANQVEGQPVVFYMGDDDQLQYIYKFVSDEVFTGPQAGETPLDTGDRFMNSGTLYAANFSVSSDGDQVGQWIPLTVDNPALITASSQGRQFEGLFDSLDSIIVHARAAAFSVGATPMDRPEWGAVNPLNGEVYFTLTNNSDRRDFDDSDPVAQAAGDQGSRDEVTEFLADREFGVVPANPRGPNSDGHIIRLREGGDDPTAETFDWEIMLFGAAVEDGPENNISGLVDDNEFTDCDGLFFDPSGLLWIQTDGGQPRGNNQMLLADPGIVGDGGITPDNNANNLRRFLVGPIDCEITGIDITADRRTLFVNIQHPGDDAEVDDAGIFTFNGNWPNDSRDASELGSPTTRPRSATVVITRDDGGVLGSDIS